jgi:hypothetical protein
VFRSGRHIAILFPADLLKTMTLKIEKRAEKLGTTIKLIGQIHQDDLGGLKAEMQQSEPIIVLDLEEIFLVDVDAIRFLAECEAQQVKINNCSLYIREWIKRERSR